MTQLFITIHCIFLIGFLSLSQTNGAGVIDIDGNQYSSVIIGSQEWMAENLRTTSYANGDPIPFVITNSQWGGLTTGAWVDYYEGPQFITTYGKLYNWFAVNDSRNLCPNGWHVPTDAEWSSLINYLDPNSDPTSQTNPPGYKMKSTGTDYWQSPNTGATNESGFSGLPGGCRSPYFAEIDISGYWWSSTESNTNNAWLRSLYHNNSFVVRTFRFKTDGFSVRCIKGEGPLEVIELIPTKKELVKILDLLGKEVEFKRNTVLIYVYSDGTTERVFKTE